MLIFRCDRCGHEERHAGIVEHAHRHGEWTTLEPLHRPGGITDLCKKCWEAYKGAVVDADREADRVGSEHRKKLLASWATPLSRGI